MTTTFNKKIKTNTTAEEMFQKMLDKRIEENGYDFPDWLSRKWVRFAKDNGIEFDDHYSRSDMMGVSERELELME